MIKPYAGYDKELDELGELKSLLINTLVPYLDRRIVHVRTKVIDRHEQGIKRAKKRYTLINAIKFWWSIRRY